MHDARQPPGQQRLRGWTRTPVTSILTFGIHPDQDLFASILDAANEAGVRYGTIVSGIGALGESTFRNVTHFPPTYPVQDTDRLYLASPGPLELVSLTGWIAPTETGEPYLHAHIAASTVQDGKVVVYGGHLAPGLVKTWIMVIVSIAVLDNMHAVVGTNPYARAEDLLVGAGPTTTR